MGKRRGKLAKWNRERGGGQVVGAILELECGIDIPTAGTDRFLGPRELESEGANERRRGISCISGRLFQEPALCFILETFGFLAAKLRGQNLALGLIGLAECAEPSLFAFLFAFMCEVDP